MNGPEKEVNAQTPEELADLIDQLMAGGSGHVNIIPQKDGNGVKVETVNSTDCGIKGACCQPTEDAVDEDDEL
ncbi:MAG: hypothetical protein IJM38_05810 [Ruminococcus sp.]|nr:hypothetical protein [Ruminococcus sp.]